MAETSCTKSPRCVVIGLDGLTFDLLDPWMKEGLLPNLSGIAARGACGVLKSLHLPLSPPAWTTITTGKNPGGHGVFGFLTLRAGTYDITTVDGRACRAPRLWDYLGQAGLKVGIFNVPVTWPPREVNGYLVGCFMTPDVTKTFTHPEALGRELHEAVGGYRIGVAQPFTQDAPLRYSRELQDLVEMRARAVEHLVRARPADFGMFVFMESDWLQHKVWHVLTDPAARDTELYRASREVYLALDRAVGRIVAACGPECNYLIVSDHGAGFHDRVFHVNKWLYDEGLLCLKKTLRLRVRRLFERWRVLPRAYRLFSWLQGRFPAIGRLVPMAVTDRAIGFFMSYDDIDWSRTRAYGRETVGQVFVNIKGREPQGIVPPEGPEYDAVVEELEARIKDLKDPRTGRPIATACYRGRRIYSGPFAAEGPDLVVVLDDFRCTCSVRFGFDTEGYFGDIEFYDSGAHRPEGIILACGPDIQPGTEIRGAGVADVTPTVLHLMGQPVPSDLDGRPLEDFLTPEFRKVHPVRRTAAGEGPPVAAEPYDEESRAQVEARLKDLGYL